MYAARDGNGMRLEPTLKLEIDEGRAMWTADPQQNSEHHAVRETTRQCRPFRLDGELLVVQPGWDIDEKHEER